MYGALDSSCTRTGTERVSIFENYAVYFEEKVKAFLIKNKYKVISPP